jgi:hypothetical protein
MGNVYVVYVKCRAWGRTWWHMSTIPALGTLKQEDSKLETSLGYIVRPISKKKKKMQGLE